MSLPADDLKMTMVLAAAFTTNCNTCCRTILQDGELKKKCNFLWGRENNCPS